MFIHVYFAGYVCNLNLSSRDGSDVETAVGPPNLAIMQGGDPNVKKEESDLEMMEGGGPDVQFESKL